MFLTNLSTFSSGETHLLSGKSRPPCWFRHGWFQVLEADSHRPGRCHLNVPEPRGTQLPRWPEGNDRYVRAITRYLRWKEVKRCQVGNESGDESNFNDRLCNTIWIYLDCKFRNHEATWYEVGKRYGSKNSTIFGWLQPKGCSELLTIGVTTLLYHLERIDG